MTKPAPDNNAANDPLSVGVQSRSDVEYDATVSASIVAQLAIDARNFTPHMAKVTADSDVRFFREKADYDNEVDMVLRNMAMRSALSPDYAAVLLATAPDLLVAAKDFPEFKAHSMADSGPVSPVLEAATDVASVAPSAITYTLFTTDGRVGDGVVGSAEKIVWDRDWDESAEGSEEDETSSVCFVLTAPDQTRQTVHVGGDTWREIDDKHDLVDLLALVVESGSLRDALATMVGIPDIVEDVLDRAEKYDFTPDEKTVNDAVRESAAILGIDLCDDFYTLASERVIEGLRESEQEKPTAETMAM